MHYTIHKRQPLGQWEFAEIVNTSFEGAGKRCQQLLAEQGADAVETRFKKTHFLQVGGADAWTYIPQFSE